jgi:hypothetical protein
VSTSQRHAGEGIHDLRCRSRQGKGAGVGSTCTRHDSAVRQSGKTVVALHRAAPLARQATDGKVLLTTFSLPLANALSRKLAIVLGEDSPALR